MTTGTVGEVWPDNMAGFVGLEGRGDLWVALAIAMKVQSPRCPDTGARHLLTALAVETLRGTEGGGVTDCELCGAVIYVPPSTCR